MPRLRRQSLVIWLDRADALEFKRRADDVGKTPEELLADLVRQVLDVEPDEVGHVVGVDKADVATIKDMINDLCSEETEPYDVDEQVSLWLHSMICMSVHNHRMRKISTGSY